MSKSLAARHRGIAIILAAYLALGVIYSLTTPVWEAPDEYAHFAYLRYIIEHRSLPVQSFTQGENIVETGHHPPLY